MVNEETLLATFRRVPDPIILATAESHPFDGMRSNTCYCGWLVRHAVAQATGWDVHTLTWADAPLAGCGCCVCRAANLFGGTVAEWDAIYTGVTMTGVSGVARMVYAAFSARAAEARATAAAGAAAVEELLDEVAARMVEAPLPTATFDLIHEGRLQYMRAAGADDTEIRRSFGASVLNDVTNWEGTS